jgi:C-terminal processing protease CtpA/Prc
LNRIKVEQDQGVVEMKFLRVLVGVVLAVGLSAPAFAMDTVEKQILAMEGIFAEMETYYGLDRYKDQTFGLTIEKLRAKYSKLFKDAMTLEEFYGFTGRQERDKLSVEQARQNLIGMIAEWKDGHTSLHRLSHNIWGVGIVPAMIDGRLYVANLNPDTFVRTSVEKQIHLGDEIIAVNGRDVQSLARERMIYAQDATFESRYRSGMISTLLFAEASYLPVKEGDDVEVTFMRGGQPFKARLNWLNMREYFFARTVYPEYFQSKGMKMMAEDLPSPYGVAGVVRSSFRQGILTLMQPDPGGRVRLPPGSVVDLGEALNLEIARTGTKGGAKALEQAGLPPMPIKRLQAYTVRYGGKTVGVLRIPSYSPTVPLEAELRWLAEAITRMNGAADVLVLDVTSNAGGYVSYVKELLAMLAGEEAVDSIVADTKLSETLLYLVDPSQADSLSSDDPLSKEKPNYGEIRISQIAFNRWLEKFKKGERYTGKEPATMMSSVLTSQGPGKINPSNHARLEIPFITINDLYSGSGGDFGPGLIQAAGLSEIIGETSCGLGAPVNRQIDSMPGSQMSFRCPMAYFELANGIPIENIGVPPNIFRGMTVADLKSGMAPYAEDILVQAVARAEGKSLEERKKIMKERVAARDPEHPGLTKKLEPVRKLLEEFRNKDAFKAAEAGLNSETAKALAKAYGELKGPLREAGQELQWWDWQRVTLPVPESLLRLDFILMSLWKRDEFVSRLQELDEVESWKKEPELMELTKAIVNVLDPASEMMLTGSPEAGAEPAVPEKPVVSIVHGVGNIRVADPCELLLTRVRAK